MTLCALSLQLPLCPFSPLVFLALSLSLFASREEYPLRALGESVNRVHSRQFITPGTGRMRREKGERDGGCGGIIYRFKSTIYLNGAVLEPCRRKTRKAAAGNNNGVSRALDEVE